MPLAPEELSVYRTNIADVSMNSSVGAGVYKTCVANETMPLAPEELSVYRTNIADVSMNSSVGASCL